MTSKEERISKIPKPVALYGTSSISSYMAVARTMSSDIEDVYSPQLLKPPSSKEVVNDFSELPLEDA